MTQDEDLMTMIRQMADFMGGRGLYAVVRDHGRFWVRDAKSLTGSKRTRGRCFELAGRAALLGLDGATYVEGIVVVCGVPLHHAWTVDASGVVRDPTLARKSPAAGFLGVPVRRDYLCRVVLRKQTWGVFEFDNPEVFDLDPREYVHQFSREEKQQ